MNIFSCISNLKRNAGMNPNSLPFINKYTTTVSLGVSGGTNFSDLSATALFSSTSMGLNLTNNNTNYALVNYNGIAMKTTDIGSDLTIYTKYKCRTNTLPILNFRFPNVITTSLATVSVGVTFTIKMFSLLEPGTLVPYSITGTGATSANLSNALLNGTMTAPYQSITYTVASGTGSTIVYNISGGIGGISLNIIIPTGFTRTVIGVSGTVTGSADFMTLAQKNTYYRDNKTTSSPLPGQTRTFNRGICVDSINRMYIANNNTYGIMRITDASINEIYSTHTNPPTSNFCNKKAICCDNTYLYIGTINSNSIRQVTLTGTLSGSFFITPECLCINTDKTIIYAIDTNFLLKSINISNGTITRLGGTTNSQHSMNTFPDISLNNALFHLSTSIAIDNNNNLYVSQQYGENNLTKTTYFIRKITAINSIITSSSIVRTIYNSADEKIQSIAIDSNNNLYYIDSITSNIWKINSLMERTLFTTRDNSPNELFINNNIMYIADKYLITSIQL